MFDLTRQPSKEKVTKPASMNLPCLLSWMSQAGAAAVKKLCFWLFRATSR